MIFYLQLQGIMGNKESKSAKVRVDYEPIPAAATYIQTRLELEERFLEMGKQCGYSGADLDKFVERKICQLQQEFVVLVKESEKSK